jgi:hypothetical protein
MLAFSSDAKTIYPYAPGFSARFASLLAEQMGNEHYVAVVHEDAVRVKDILGHLSKALARLNRESTLIIFWGWQIIQMHDEHIGVGLRRRLGAANFDQWFSFDHGAFPYYPHSCCI